MKFSKKTLILLVLAASMLAVTLSGDVRFLISFITNPSAVGAIKPSSKQLTKYMVETIPTDAIVLELGAGTGPFTEELTKIVPKENLYIVENNPEFYAILKQKFPNHTVLLLDAQELHKKLPPSVLNKINYVVSGLPFRSLPPKVATNIIASLKKVTNKNLTLVQFTYLPQPPLSPKLTQKLNVKGKFYKSAPLNMPPAKVWIYKSRKIEKPTRP